MRELQRRILLDRSLTERGDDVTSRRERLAVGRPWISSRPDRAEGIRTIESSSSNQTTNPRIDRPTTIRTTHAVVPMVVDP